MPRSVVTAFAFALLLAACSQDEGVVTAPITASPTPTVTAAPTATASPADPDTPSAEPTETTTAETPTSTPTPATEAPATADPTPTGDDETDGQDPSTVTAAGAMQAWIGAIADGDMDAAWELTAEASREAVGGREGFESLSSGLQEGWGQWARTEGAIYNETIVVSAGDDALAVVSVHGTISQEGMTERRAAALPVAAIAGEYRVNPFAAAEGFVIEFEEPGEDGTLAAYVPAATEVTFAVDGEAVTPEVEGADGDQQRAVTTAALPPGEHVLAVIYQGSSGVGADALLFEVD